VSGNYTFTNPAFTVTGVDNSTKTVNNISFTDGLNQAASGDDWVIKALFPTTAPAQKSDVTDTSVSVGTNADVLTVTLTGGTFEAVNSLKAYYATSGGNITITTSSSGPADTSALANTVEIAQGTGTNQIVLTFPEAAGATAAANALTTGTIDVTVKGDAQATQATAAGAEATISPIRQLAVVLTSGTPTVDAAAKTVTLTANATAGTAVTVPAGVTLDTGAFTLTLTASSGSLVLATASETSVGKISGTGGIVAGATTITGAWEATATTTTAGTLTIASAATGATITADGSNATGLKASAAGATITQAAGTSNNLTIAAATTIDLQGTISSGTTVGSIVLTESTTSNEGGKLTLTASTGTIKVGSETDASSALSTDGGDFVTTAAAGKITVSNLTNVSVFPGDTTTSKVNTIKGGTADGSLQAFSDTGGTGTVTINASTTVS
jgi:hypothetical protein